jgi:hypothetical protein
VEVVGRFWTWNGVWSDKVTGDWKDSASQIGVGKTNSCENCGVFFGGCAGMATYSLTCRPLTSVGGSAREISYGGVHKDVHASAMVSSASHLKLEAARLCQEAAQTKNVSDVSLVSSFWSIGSRRGLLTSKMSCSESVRRPGGHLMVVRLSLAHAAISKDFVTVETKPIRFSLVEMHA